MALKENIKAPQFKSIIEDGSEISLKDFIGKWIVLYFYPKDNTSGCTKEACDFRDNMIRISSTGAVVLGVSPDSPKSHLNFISKHSLNFTLISDTEKALCTLYEVMGEKSMYGRKYMGVIRSTYIISPDQKIKKVFSPVSVTGHVDEVINFLEENK
jgi:peroxiredoxin Q/BCP